MKILVTGGAGYIGSHFLETFMESKYAANSKIWVLDDLSNGHIEFIDRLRILAKENGVAEFHFDQESLLNEAFVLSYCKQISPDIVYHFAGKISVAESVKDPDLYFNHNVKGTKNLLAGLHGTNCANFVFSSTAAVYQQSFDQQPLCEDFPLGPNNPYGENKLQVERMIESACTTWNLNAVIFRYFNASGASPSGRFGEWHEPETHLIPLMLEEGRVLKVYGSDYPTRDGTCIRDYIHVSDLADAHLSAIPYLKTVNATFAGVYEIFNLGTNRGVTVLEMIQAASKVLGRKIEFTFAERREGDAAVLVASSDKAREMLKWDAKRSDLESVIQSAHLWQRQLKSMLRR